MAVYPDEFTIWETFLDGIPAEMHHVLIRDDNLSPEVNTGLPANLQAISEEEFRGTLKRGDGLDQSITNDRKAVIKPDKAQLLKKTHVKQVDSMECQPTSSRVKVEDLVIDEEEQSAASALETTK
ncbi:hypothetical protein C0995_003479, partial [Termitomyces sp. Mi166